MGSFRISLRQVFESMACAMIMVSVLGAVSLATGCSVLNPAHPNSMDVDGERVVVEVRAPEKGEESEEAKLLKLAFPQTPYAWSQEDEKQLSDLLKKKEDADPANPFTSEDQREFSKLRDKHRLSVLMRMPKEDLTTEETSELLELRLRLESQGLIKPAAFLETAAAASIISFGVSTVVDLSVAAAKRDSERYEASFTGSTGHLELLKDGERNSGVIDVKRVTYEWQESKDKENDSQAKPSFQLKLGYLLSSMDSQAGRVLQIAPLSVETNSAKCKVAQHRCWNWLFPAPFGLHHLLFGPFGQLSTEVEVTVEGVASDGTPLSVTATMTPFGENLNEDNRKSEIQKTGADVITTTLANQTLLSIAIAPKPQPPEPPAPQPEASPPGTGVENTTSNDGTLEAADDAKKPGPDSSKPEVPKKEEPKKEEPKPAKVKMLAHNSPVKITITVRQKDASNAKKTITDGAQIASDNKQKAIDAIVKIVSGDDEEEDDE